jgi:hypothetical protein
VSWADYALQKLVQVDIATRQSAGDMATRHASLRQYKPVNRLIDLCIGLTSCGTTTG